MISMHNNFQIAYETHMAGDVQSARKLYEDILLKEPRHVDARYMLGTLLAEGGQLEEALAHLKSAASLQPSSPMIQTNLGNVYLKLDKLDQAKDCYQRALKHNPRMPETLFNLGLILYQQKKPDKAASCFEKCLQAKPDFTSAYLKLGHVYRELKRPEYAAACFQKVIELSPHSIEALTELGNLLAASQDIEGATHCFRQVLTIDPENYSARHAVAALTGETTAAAPASHVAHLFDELSQDFEHHLKQLGYRAPALFRQMVIELWGEGAHFDHAIDLGCGTGLSGEQFRPMINHLTGLDLSPKMIELARSKNLYDELTTDELCHYLKNATRQYDLFIATDVFAYIGDLSEVFASIQERAMPGGCFLFSTEESLQQDFMLQPTGRYAHARHYIETLALRHGFTLAAHQTTDLRMEGDKHIKADLFVLGVGKNG